MTGEATPTTPTSCASTSTRIRAATSTTPPSPPSRSGGARRPGPHRLREDLGNRGVHVHARIEPTHEFLDVRHGVIAIARELERRLPDLVTTSWWKEERGEKVFVDFNQANRDRTIASAFSPRPLKGAPVSMPVAWDDLTESRRPTSPCGPCPCRWSRRATPWASMPDSVGTSRERSRWWERDVADGLPELNFPPDYPKMPGEPPRVQPSRARRPSA